MNDFISGKVNSIQTLGTLDGPGVRFVVFLQGCNLRCGCCHNPDTWHINGGTVYSAEEIAAKAKRYKSYFKNEGGITVSGGEPLLQAKFVKELFELCHKDGINTCLDTSGSIMNDDVKSLLDVTDYVLLDIKYTNNEDYKAHVGCELSKPLEFLKLLSEKNIPTVIRQVIIPTLNDNEDNILKLKEISKNYGNIKKTELLPFKKICAAKYENLKIPFKFGNLPTPDGKTMQKLEDLLLK